MSKAVALVSYTDLTPEQVDLVKRTIAKDATNDELTLFLYRCKELDLDPLKPGQIHFIKYNKSSAGTIVIGIDGFRSIAERTGKRAGSKRGAIRNAKGELVGAWCEVYRKDWTHPAREEVSLVEYNTGRGPWLKMPETMIKKVAEAAALRMAFPENLSGLYSDDEMGQAENGQAEKEVSEQSQTARKMADEMKAMAETPKPKSPFEGPADPGEYVVKVAPFMDTKIKDCDPAKLENIVLQLIEAAKDPERAKKMSKSYEELMKFGGDYLEYLDQQPIFDESEDFPYGN